MRVLVVDDDPMFAQLVQAALRAEGYAADVAHDAAEGRMLAFVHDYDGIVLDFVLPDGSGVEIVRELRRRGKSTPVLMLTARAEVGDRVLGLDAGADDYLTKPFAMEELRARLRAVIRRGGAQRTEQIATGRLVLNRLNRKVFNRGKEMQLTPKEFSLLEHLMLHADAAVTRGDLLEKVWDMHFDPGSNVVDTHVARLRAKLRKAETGVDVQTVRGVGYMLSALQAPDGDGDSVEPPAT
jgi:two-component system, OmpR family, response regulator